MKDCKPFVKWVGGKTQLLKNIEKSLPYDLLKAKNITYIEPFVGGGAVLFWMLKNFPNISNAIINDINPDLTNTYSVIKDNPQHLIEFLSNIENQYYTLDNLQDKQEFYLNQREVYNTNNTC